EQGREVLTYVEGEVVRSDGFVPDQGGRFDMRAPDYLWRDEVLVHLGGLIRAYHDAAATFPWAGREWYSDARQPAETVCHNDLGGVLDEGALEIEWMEANADELSK